MDEVILRSLLDKHGYVGDREADILFFNKATDELGLKLFRDSICGQIAGHADIDQLNDDEWSQFSDRFSKFILKVRAAEKFST